MYSVNTPTKILLLRYEEKNALYAIWNQWQISCGNKIIILNRFGHIVYKEPDVDTLLIAPIFQLIFLENLPMTQCFFLLKLITFTQYIKIKDLAYVLMRTYSFNTNLTEEQFYNLNIYERSSWILLFSLPEDINYDAILDFSLLFGKLNEEGRGYVDSVKQINQVSSDATGHCYKQVFEALLTSLERPGTQPPNLQTVLAKAQPYADQMTAVLQWENRVYGAGSARLMTQHQEKFEAEKQKLETMNNENCVAAVAAVAAVAESSNANAPSSALSVLGALLQLPQQTPTALAESSNANPPPTSQSSSAALAPSSALSMLGTLLQLPQNTPAAAAAASAAPASASASAAAPASTLDSASAAAALPQTPAPLTTNDASAIPVTKGGRFLKTQRKKKIRNTSYKRKKYKNNNI